MLATDLKVMKWFCLLGLVSLEISGVHTQNRSQWLGTPASLVCLAEEEVDCAWLWNDQPIHIDDRYRFTAPSDSTNTRDCSITIGMFHYVDVGNWSCWSMSTDSSEGRLLQSYNVTIKTKQSDSYVRTSPQSFVVSPGQNVTLLCQFLVAVEKCQWLRQGRPLSVSGRYRLRGEYCTLDITNVQPIDAGKWRCTTPANNAFGYIQSKEATLTVRRDPSVVVPAKPNDNVLLIPPTNQMATIGDTVVLYCTFLYPVECTWLRQDWSIFVGYRYGYVRKMDSEKTGRRDCSLTISNVQQIDHGRWRCVAAANDSVDAISSNEVSITIKSREDQLATIHQHPEDLAVHFGANISFFCKFNATVDCSWRRNRKVVRIKDRYSYVGPKWRNVTDCSISIRSVEEIDIGTWTCESIASYTNRSVEATESILSILKMPSAPEILLDNEHIPSWVVMTSSTSGKNLTCVSKSGNPAPSLRWKSGDLWLAGVGSTYRSRSGSEEHVYDTYLSLDFGRLWSTYGNVSLLTCIAAHPSFQRDLSTMIGLYWPHPPSTEEEIRELPVIVRQPTSRYLALGSNVSLECVFDRPIRCRWTLVNMYNETTEHDLYGDTLVKDCSMTISLFQEKHFGYWQCIATNASSDVRSDAAFLYKQKMGEVTIKWNDEPVPKVRLLKAFKPHSLTCHGFGLPAPKLQWYRNGTACLASNSTTAYQQDFRDTQHVTLYWDFDRYPLSTFGNGTSTLRCAATHPSLVRELFEEVPATIIVPPIGPSLLVSGFFNRRNEVVISSKKRHPDYARCFCFLGYPAATMWWTVDGRKVPGLALVGRNLELRVDPSLGHQFGLMTLSTELRWLTPGQWRIPRRHRAELVCWASHPGFEGPQSDKSTIFFENFCRTGQTVGMRFCRMGKVRSCFTRPTANNVMWWSSLPRIATLATPPASALGGYPVATLWWTVDGRKVPGYTLTGPTLEMDLDSLHSSQSNLTGLATILHWLTPDDDDPWVVEPPSDAEVDAGLPVRLRCRFDKPTECCWKLDDKLTDPVKHDYWYEATPGGRNTTDCSITIARFTPELAGRWQCCSRPLANLVDIVPPFEARLTLAVPQCTDLDPVIMVNNTAVAGGQLELRSRSDLQYVRCVSSEGGSIPHLYWEVNGQPLPESDDQGRPGKHGLFTAELLWLPSKVEEDFGEDGVLLTCVKEVHGHRSPCSTNVTVTIPKSTSSEPWTSSLLQDIEEISWDVYVIVGVSSVILLGLVAGVSVVMYLRFYKNSMVNGSARLWCDSLSTIFCFRRIPKDEPLVAYSADNEEDSSGVSNVVY